MATIDLKKQHSLTLDAAKQKAEEIAKSMADKLGMNWEWSGDTIHFDASSGVAKGTKGLVAVTSKDIHVSIDLPLMLRVMKGKVEEKLQEKLSQLV